MMKKQGNIDANCPKSKAMLLKSAHNGQNRDLLSSLVNPW
jgi:hypothetical protein